MGKTNRAKNQYQQSRGKAVLKTMLICAGVLLCMILAFWLALAIVYAIPSSFVEGNVKSAAEVLQKEGEYPASYVNEKSMDNYTVAIMLNEASQASDNPIFDSLRNEKWSGGEKQYDNLFSGINGNDDMSRSSYYRYWHGYLVLLKPLLVFMGLYRIRMLFQFLFAVTSAAFAILAAVRMKRVGPYVGLASVIAFLALDCFNASACLPFFFSFEISAAAMIAMLFVDIGNKRKVLIVFLIIGALTVYFDFLDNPILTLGLPLAVLVVREWDSPSEKGTKIRHLLLFCVAWATGYGGAWAAKWLLATLVLGENVMGNAWEQVVFRTGIDESASKYGGFGLSRVFVPVVSIRRMGTPLCLVLFAVLVAGIVLLVSARIRNKAPLGLASTYIKLIIVALLPVLWMLVFSNHTSIHTFTYRDYAISVFCILSAFSIVLYDRIKITKRSRKIEIDDSAVSLDACESFRR